MTPAELIQKSEEEKRRLTGQNYPALTEEGGNEDIIQVSATLRLDLSEANEDLAIENKYGNRFGATPNSIEIDTCALFIDFAEHHMTTHEDFNDIPEKLSRQDKKYYAYQIVNNPDYWLKGADWWNFIKVGLENWGYQEDEIKSMLDHLTVL